jgi:hypothetical protein
VGGSEWTVTRLKSIALLVLGLTLGSTWAVWSQDGTGPIGNLRGKVDENHALYVNAGTVDTNIVNVPSVQISNIDPTTSPTSAVASCGIFTTASTNATRCADSVANLYGIYYAINTTGTEAWIRLINTASATPTCTDSVAVPPIPIPAESAAGVHGGISIPMINPIHFTTGIGVCVTGASDGTGNATAAISILLAVKE